ncbi:MAG: carboxypeptidase-like regulatory domain-containing protein, partial [Bacteroidota bacterium]
MNRHIRIFIFLLLGFSFVPSVLNAQERMISGKITDQSGQELIGVNIMLKGTTNGTITDFEGNYSLRVTGDTTDLRLIVSYIGYESLEVAVGRSTILDLTMKEASENLEEVVVIGYGTQRKIDLTGSVSNVKTDQLETVPLSSVSQALQGRAAGVNITQNTGAPGEGVAVRIRGVGSI